MSDDPDPAAPAPADPTELADRLVAAEVLRERTDDRLAVRSEFQRTYAVYRDVYLDADDEEFRDGIADAFWLEPDEAAARIEEFGVTREELAAFLALRSFLDEEPETVDLATMASLVVDANPPSPVPESLTELDDETYEPYLDAHPDAVVFAWKRNCSPCEVMKEEFDEVLAALPEGHDVAGVDGGLSADFRSTFGLTAAPSVLCFRDGELVETAEGRQRPDDVAVLAERVYGDGG